MLIFEIGQYDGNCAAGKYNYGAIITKLKELKSQIDEETEKWKEKGKGKHPRIYIYIYVCIQDLADQANCTALTKNETGWKYYQLMEEAEKFKSGKVEALEAVSAAPVEEDNLFYWQASIFGPETSMWEGTHLFR